MREALKDGSGPDGLLVTDMRNVRYLTGFTGSNAQVVVGPRKLRFLTDTRYTTQSKDEVPRPFAVRVYRNKKGIVAGAEAAVEVGLKLLGFEGDNLTYNSYLDLRKALRGEETGLRHTTGLVARLRASKDPFEVERIRDSARVLDKGFEAAAEALRPGVAEQDVAHAIEAEYTRLGAEGVAFDTIVASGPRGALPHGKASEKKVNKGELVVVDTGALVNGYNSDQTRTFCVGSTSKKQREVYEVVRGAQAAAVEAAGPGVKASEVDAVARKYITEAGYGKYFTHATGHGVGLDVHEGPFVGPGSDVELTEGMVITVEPGVYIPGWGGVRIEDMVLVTGGGRELLTNSPRELVCL